MTYFDHVYPLMLYSHIIEWGILGFSTGETKRITSIVLFWAVSEIYITEDIAPGTIIYKAVAKDPEDAVLEVICLLE